MSRREKMKKLEKRKEEKRKEKEKKKRKKKKKKRRKKKTKWEKKEGKRKRKLWIPPMHLPRPCLAVVTSNHSRPAWSAARQGYMRRIQMESSIQLCQDREAVKDVLFLGKCDLQNCKLPGARRAPEPCVFLRISRFQLFLGCRNATVHEKTVPMN